MEHNVIWVKFGIRVIFEHGKTNRFETNNTLIISSILLKSM